MNRHVLAVMLIALLHCSMAEAQMTFTFKNDASAKTSEQPDGTVVYTLPGNVSLAKGECIAGVKVNGVEVDASAIVPNPKTTLITEGEIETFVYDNKAYSFRFMHDEYFTVVMFADPHVGNDKDGSPDDNNLTKDEMSGYVRDMIRLGKAGGQTVDFGSDAPTGFIPTCDLVICLGDMDPYKPVNKGNDFKESTSDLFAAAGIPFVTLLGNHDLHPDYITGGTSNKGVTWGLNDGGAYYDNLSINIMSSILNTAKANGISDVTVFEDDTHSGSNYAQAKPFTFTFNGVRFYAGQTYWFQKIYKKPSMVSAATYYAPDKIVEAFENCVTSNKSQPSVFLQHYPFWFGDGCDRWWLDENSTGDKIQASDEASSKYPYSSGVDVRKNKMTSIMKLTGSNPVTFSGHAHEYNTTKNNGVTDYSVAAISRHKGAALVVLCKKDKGVIATQQITFSNISE